MSSNQESKREEKPTRKGRWENAFSGKQLDNVRKETLVVSVMIPRMETDAIRDKKDNRPVLHQKRKSSGRRGESPSGTSGRIPCRIFLRRKCTYLSCNFLHPTVCLNNKSESGCKNGDTCRFRHVEADGQPSKILQRVEEKWCERFSCLINGVYTIQLCVSRFSSEKVYSSVGWKIGIKSHRQILQGHVASHKNSGKKGSIARRHSKV